jgi:hypothetical protein
LSIELNTVSVAGEDGDDSDVIEGASESYSRPRRYRPYTLTEVNATCAAMRLAMSWSGPEVE